MEKVEALAVLHEIFDVCKESICLTFISLEPKQEKQEIFDYVLRLKGDLDNASRHRILSILEKRKLSLKEEQGYVLIF